MPAGLRCPPDPGGYRYYQCRGRTDPLRAAQGQRCTARYIPAGQLDELVWADLCALLTDPAQVARALARAQGGAWLPQELHARQTAIRQALGQLDRQQQRLLDAYLAEIMPWPNSSASGTSWTAAAPPWSAQHASWTPPPRSGWNCSAVADGIEAFCQAIRTGLATATFEQRRQLAELLIDRVIVTDGQVEIRYVLPTSPDGPHRPFCQLRKDHLDPPPDFGQPDEFPDGGVSGQGGQPVVSGLVRLGWPFGQQPASWPAAVVGAGDVPVGGADPDGQEVAGHRGVRVVLGGFRALPPGHLPDFVLAGDRSARRFTGRWGKRAPAGGRTAAPARVTGRASPA